MSKVTIELSEVLKLTYPGSMLSLALGTWTLYNCFFGHVSAYTPVTVPQYRLRTIKTQLCLGFLKVIGVPSK